MEQIQPTGLLSRWLIEIGSDIRLYGFTSASLVCVGLMIEIYFKGYSVVIFKLIEVVINIWVFLSVIALIETSEKHFKIVILRSNILEIDKRNYSTLIPVVASILKLLSYGLVSLAVLNTVGVDIRPILNVGAIALAALMYAGSETIKDVLATLKFFLTRKLYVGSYVRINNLRPGVVVRMTIFDTWVESENSDGSKFVQVINNGLIAVVVLIDEALPPES